MIEIFQYDFMLRALAAGIVIAVLAPLVGIFLVSRRLSLLADTLAHVSLLGVALGALAGIHPTAGALVAGGAAALGMEALRRKGIAVGETVLALFLSGSLAIAVVIFAVTRGLNINLIGYLFGSISTVTQTDVWIITALGIATGAIVIYFFKPLFVASMDEDLAKAGGLPAAALNTLLLVLAAIVVGVSIQAVGALLIGALLVIPVLAAAQYGLGFSRSALLAIIFSVLSMITGLIVAFYLNLPTGGTVVIVALLIFGGSVVINSRAHRTR